MDWNELSNSEIEVKLKEIEFEYENIKTEIYNKYKKLSILNTDYIEGKSTLDKRLTPMINDSRFV